jgi:hypothetical protein
MLITETISDINRLIIKTALMHRDDTAEAALSRAIGDHFPGQSVDAVLRQGEINEVLRARERAEQAEADKLVKTFPDLQDALFPDDPTPVVWVPNGIVKRKGSLSEGLEWARGYVARKRSEAEAHERMLAIARERLQDAEHKLEQHEQACAWCHRHGLDPSKVSYADVRDAQTA